MLWGLLLQALKKKPHNPIRPFLDGNMLQLIFLAVLVGVAVGMIGDYSRPLKELFRSCNRLFLKITTMIVGVMPLAVFCSAYQWARRVYREAD